MLADLADYHHPGSTVHKRQTINGSELIGQLPFDAKVFNPSPLSLNASVETVECESMVTFCFIILRSAGGRAGVLLAFEKVTVLDLASR
jgi:hypothetical protein